MTNSTATGMSVSCSGVSSPKKLTTGPNGITAKVTKAGTVASTGARRKTALSAALGTMSSFSASFTPSASDCSRPNGPCTLGPMRCCIRATTRRSHQMLKSVSRTRTRKTRTALRPMTHHGSWPNSSSIRDLHARARARQVGEQAAPGRGGREPDDVVGDVGDLRRDGDGATVAGDGDRGAEPLDGGGAQPGHRRPGGGGQGLVALLEDAVVEQEPPGRQLERPVVGRRCRCGGLDTLGRGRPHGSATGVARGDRAGRAGRVEG